MIPKAWRYIAAATMAISVVVAQADPQYVPHQVPANAGPLPFSDAVIVGDTIYVSGHIGFDPKTGLPPADAATEAKIVLDAFQATLKSAGVTMDDLVSVTVYCSDLSLYATFNSAYTGYFHGNYPARAFLGVASLLRGARFEVQGIAVKSAAAHH